MGDAHWLVIHVARGREKAGTILSVLEQEGFMARMKQIRDEGDLRGGLYEIQALHSEAGEARVLLLEKRLLG